MSGPAPNFSQSGLYVERKHDEKNITRAVDKVTLTSASCCAINVYISFSKPDLFNCCLLLRNLRVDMDSPFLSVLAVTGTCCSSRQAAVLRFGMPSRCTYGGPKHMMAGMGKPAPRWLWTSSCVASQREMFMFRAGGVRTAMSAQPPAWGLWRLVHASSQHCHGDPLPQ